MAIVKFSFLKIGSENEYPEGAYCSLGESNSESERTRSGEYMILWELYKGLCLVDTERNYYNDSDFVMTIWDDELGEPFEYMFATTRGWTYPSYGSRVDATPEVVAKYEAWKEAKRLEALKKQRSAKAKELAAMRATMWKISSENNVPFLKVKELSKIYRGDTYSSIEKLMTTKLRSEFRKSLKNQILSWLKSENDFKTPLSKRQMNYL